MYRKFKADEIFTGYEILPGNYVLVTDQNGMISDIVNTEDAGDDIENFTGILTPGFINCHCHLELSHMKGLIPKKTGLVDFVFKVVNERHIPEEEIISAIDKAETEMIRNGIVAVGDICNTGFTLKQKSQGNLYYHNFIETLGFPPNIASIRFDHAVELHEAFSKLSSSTSIAAHAPYSVSQELFRKIDEFPSNNIVSIHNQEISAENEFFEKGTGDLLTMYEKMGIDISFFTPPGKSSLQTWLPYFTRGQSIISVHNVATSEKDLEFVATTVKKSSTGFFFCLCPNANLYISNSLPGIDLLINHGCNIVLGTDSLASNDQLSILEEIKILVKEFPSLKPEAVLQWATINGANALGIESKYGSFEKEKNPGVVLIKTNGNGEWMDAKRII